MMTFPCRMQAYVSKELSKGIISLSPMLIIERTIVGYSLRDTNKAGYKHFESVLR